MSDGMCMNCNCNECRCDEEPEGNVIVIEQEYPPVLTKRDFVRRYNGGEFGNHSPTWDTLREFLNSNYQGGLIHLRNRIAGGETWYNVAPNDIDLYWTEALYSGLTPNDLYISAMAPTEKTLIQGEVLQTEHGLNLFYSRIAKPMRDALKEDSHTVTGSVAQKFLEYFLCSNSYEWMQTLLERYPLHVIEFSTYDCYWGTVPRHNTAFWEVRMY